MRGRLARRVREAVRGNGLAARPVPRPGPTLHLCALTGTLIADADGIYHPASYNDRLVLGLKGTLSECEPHLLRSRMTEGLRAKAARGELRLTLPGRAGL